MFIKSCRFFSPSELANVSGDLFFFFKEKTSKHIWPLTDNCQTVIIKLLINVSGISEKIPFIKPAPIDEEATKKLKKNKKGGGDKPPETKVEQ